MGLRQNDGSYSAADPTAVVMRDPLSYIPVRYKLLRFWWLYRSEHCPRGPGEAD